MRKFIFVLALLSFVPAAFADTLPKPPCIAKTIKTDTPHGQGELSRLFLKVYDAALWTDAPQWSMDKPFALEMKYDVSLDTDDIVDNSIEQMEHIDSIPKDKLENYKIELTKVFPNIKKGDTITAICEPGKGATFYHNDKATGRISDHDLVERFFSIWFSPSTSEPKLRSQLLGEHNA